MIEIGKTEESGEEKGETSEDLAVYIPAESRLQQILIARRAEMRGRYVVYMQR
jgi:hypothetical protein